MKTPLVVTLLGFVGACGNPQDKLPPMMGHGVAGDCSSSPVQPDDVSNACFWLPGFGSVVIATVEAIDSSTAPFDDGSCDGVNEAIVVRYAVDEQLRGDEVPDVIDVRYGDGQRSQWSPFAGVGADGSVTWGEASTEATGPLIVGQRVGLHVDNPDDTDSYISLKTIGLLADGSVHLSTGGCDNPLTPYASRAAFDADLAACPAADGDGALFAGLGDATCSDER